MFFCSVCRRGFEGGWLATFVALLVVPELWWMVDEDGVTQIGGAHSKVKYLLVTLVDQIQIGFLHLDQ